MKNLCPKLCYDQVTTNSAFLPFVIGIQFTDQILRTLRKMEHSFDDFQSKRNRNPKADNFFTLTYYRQLFLKVRSSYSKFLENYRNFLVDIVFICKYSVQIWFNFSLFMTKTYSFNFKRSGKIWHFLTEQLSFIDQCVHKYF